MKKSGSLDRVEKTVLLIGILLIPVSFGLGFAKNATLHKEPYVSVMKESDASVKEASGLQLKSKEFTLKQHGDLSMDAADYFDGSSEQVKKVKLDLTDVDISEPGTYKAKASSGKKSYSFKIKVVKSDNPIITAQKSSFKYLIGSYSSIREVIEIAGVSAVDKDGNDLSEEISGWPKELPSKEGEKSYRLSVSDSYGNTGYLTVTIDFQKVVN